MKYKLLVLDVDGTLLNDEREISKRTLAALLKVQQMGVRIVLASGRPTYGLMPLAKTLELGNYGGFVLSYNGCQIIKAQNGEILFERRINPEMLPYLEKKARKNGFAIFTYHDDTLITDSPDNEYIKNEALLNNLKIIKEDEFSTAIDFAPCKCMLVSDKEKALIGLEQHWEKRLAGTSQGMASLSTARPAAMEHRGMAPSSHSTGLPMALRNILRILRMARTPMACRCTMRRTIDGTRCRLSGSSCRSCSARPD